MIRPIQTKIVHDQTAAHDQNDNSAAHLESQHKKSSIGQNDIRKRRASKFASSSLPNIVLSDTWLFVLRFKMSCGVVIFIWPDIIFWDAMVVVLVVYCFILWFDYRIPWWWILNVSVLEISATQNHRFLVIPVLPIILMYIRVSWCTFGIVLTKANYGFPFQFKGVSGSIFEISLSGSCYYFSLFLEGRIHWIFLFRLRYRLRR